MIKSENIGKLAAALSKAQAALQPATKNATNPHFKSRYADLGAIWDACREPLTANELSVTQLPECDEGTSVVTVTTVLLHSSGEWIGSVAKAKPRDFTPQSVGSVITYLRRYGLAAVVGIAAEEDDDAESAQPQNGAARPAPRPAAPAPTRQPAAPDSAPAANKPSEGAVVVDHAEDEAHEQAHRETDAALKDIYLSKGKHHSEWSAYYAENLEHRDLESKRRMLAAWEKAAAARPAPQEQPPPPPPAEPPAPATIHAAVKNLITALAEIGVSELQSREHIARVCDGNDIVERLDKAQAAKALHSLQRLYEKHAQAAARKPKEATKANA